jgi:hypothetical protein
VVDLPHRLRNPPCLGELTIRKQQVLIGSTRKSMVMPMPCSRSVRAAKALR